MLLDLKTRSVTQVAGSTMEFVAARWSPDGRWVIALSADSQKLFLLDMNTQEWRQLADKIGIIGYMTWSRDSKYVGFDTSFIGRSRIFSRVSRRWTGSASCKPEQHPQVFPAMGGMERIGARRPVLLVRDISTQEIDARDRI